MTFIYVVAEWYISGVITGSAVALHCCKAHAKRSRKMGNSTPCKIVTPKNFILKLCTRDYLCEVTRHANFGCNRYSGASPQIGEILQPCDFFDCPVLFLPFFSILRPSRTARPIFTLYGSNHSAQGWSFYVLEQWVVFVFAVCTTCKLANLTGLFRRVACHTSTPL